MREMQLPKVVEEEEKEEEDMECLPFVKNLQVVVEREALEWIKKRT